MAVSNLAIMSQRGQRAQRTFIAVAALAVCIAHAEVGARTAPATTQAEPHQIGVCARESVKIVKQAPVRIGGSIRPPKKTHNVSPVYPDIPKGTTARAGGVWIGEALVDSTGKVSRVWSIREVTFTPAVPVFNATIVDAIRQWEYEPLIVGGKPTPFCMTVSMNIHWR